MQHSQRASRRRRRRHRRTVALVGAEGLVLDLTLAAAHAILHMPAPPTQQAALLKAHKTRPATLGCTNLFTAAGCSPSQQSLRPRPPASLQHQPAKLTRMQGQRYSGSSATHHPLSPYSSSGLTAPKSLFLPSQPCRQQGRSRGWSDWQAAGGARAASGAGDGRQAARPGSAAHRWQSRGEGSGVATGWMPTLRRPCCKQPLAMRACMQGRQADRQVGRRAGGPSPCCGGSSGQWGGRGAWAACLACPRGLLGCGRRRRFHCSSSGLQVPGQYRCPG